MLDFRIVHDGSFWVAENGSFTAELNGFSIHYEVHGQGPVVMTLPNSWGLSLGGLRALYRSLEDTLTIVYFDPRGMGESAPIKEDSDMSMAAVRADFDALRRHLGLEKVNALGWSNGATNLILLASEKPDTLSTAVFLHGSASHGPEDMKGFAERYPELLALIEREDLFEETHFLHGFEPLMSRKILRYRRGSRLAPVDLP